jgi:ABC-type cobalamin/Fe3+-siderophores transport system ATPase subunit
MSAKAIEFENLSVAAGGRTILEIERLSVGIGEMLAVMGPNGAGKSTLLRTCLGMQRNVRGVVRVLGRDACRLNGLAMTRVRRSIGYVPQVLPVRSEMPLTVREVVSMGRTGRAGLFRPLNKADWRIVDEWMDRLGILALAGRAFHEISGGEQRKAVIARAMAHEPELLLLDEPTANLDIGWRERMVETVQGLFTRTRLAVILVCHELEVLPACCARVVLLHQGRVVASGPPEQVFTNQQVEALYGRGLAAVHAGGRHAVIPTGGPL